MMGGPMGVYEADAHPWIACNRRRLIARLEADRPTLGVGNAHPTHGPKAVAAGQAMIAEWLMRLAA
jgi:hypothetical protein